MAKQKKRANPAAKSTIVETKATTELNEQELRKISGGTGTLMEACATGKHLPEVKL